MTQMHLFIHKKDKDVCQSLVNIRMNWHGNLRSLLEFANFEAQIVDLLFNISPLNVKFNYFFILFYCYLDNGKCTSNQRKTRLEKWTKMRDEYVLFKFISTQLLNKLCISATSVEINVTFFRGWRLIAIPFTF